ncbi:MAG: hypothetical protein Q9178_002364 [Gyalolechia marmorata]
MDRFVLGEIKDESVGANCRPQAMTATDWYEWGPTIVAMQAENLHWRDPKEHTLPQKGLSSARR